MKFSLITPTHMKNAFLEDLYDSITKQTYDNWEWIIYLNGVVSNDVPQNIQDDPRVKIYVSLENNPKVGFNKNRAFSLATGDILVEMDHDDILTPDCLEELHKAFRDNPEAGFVFSDDAKYYMSGEKGTPFNAFHGWTHYDFPWNGKQLLAHNSFQPSSRSICFIWYAPDHVRAWRRSVYEELGGHNEELDICDDHELMIRTYLKTEMYHIPKVLYIYRITGENTWLERNKAIQDKTKELMKQYSWDLACRDAKKNGKHIVELGGGINPKAGCEINIDLEEGNLKHDLNDGIPLEDNSVGVIWASHIIEHLHDKNKIMAEIHRVLCDGGWAFIQVPSTDGRGAFQDPTHVSYWNENSFWYYTRADKAKFIRNDTIKFQEYKLETFWWDDQIAITDAWLVAIKSDERRPGLRRI